MWCRLVLGEGGGEVPHPPWMCRVGVRRRLRLVVLVEWLSRVGVGPGGPFGVDVVAGRIRFLVRGGVAPGGRRGMGVGRPGATIPCAGAARARGVVARSGRVVGSGSVGGGVGGGGGGGVGGGGAGTGGDGVAGMALGSLVDIPVPPEGWGVGHRLQPLGPYGLVGSGGGLGAGLNGDHRSRGPTSPGRSGRRRWWFFRGWMMGRLDMGMLTRIGTGSCLVAASVVAAAAGGVGSRDVVGGVSWFGLGLGLGRGGLCCRRSFCGVGGCVGWCWCCCCWWWCGGVAAGAVVAFWFWFGFGVGSSSRLRKTSSWRCKGTGAGWGGATGVLSGCLGRLCGAQGASGSLACGCSFGFGCGFVNEVG